jgi:hypothetical protein
MPNKHCSGDQIRKNKMGGSCSTYGEDDRCIQDFGTETTGKEDHLEDLCVDGRILSKWIFKKEDRGRG